MSICKLFGKGCDYLCKPFRGRIYCIDDVLIVLFILLLLYFVICIQIMKNFPSMKKFIKYFDLSRPFADCNGCTLYAIGHFIYYMILGFLFPHLLFELTIIGIVWEFTETWLVSYKKISLFDSLKALNKRDYDTWFGCVSDIAFNVSGSVVGWKLRQYFN